MSLLSVPLLLPTFLSLWITAFISLQHRLISLLLFRVTLPVTFAESLANSILLSTTLVRFDNASL